LIVDAVNRWCVSGTPIGRSIADLFGLFSFIRQDPYNVKKWFKELLFEPFVEQDKMPMAKATSEVLWRSAKRQVIDQIDIPPQTEKLYWLDFSPFEKHLYERVLEMFRQEFKRIRNSNDLFKTTERDHLGLDELDRQSLTQLLSPILDLRLTCNHPQLILRKKSFMTQSVDTQKQLLTMEKSLEMLMKKTQTECDQLYRESVMHKNAVAGKTI
jgi:E3 ubiquitin-protein ligase SHPRH